MKGIILVVSILFAIVQSYGQEQNLAVIVEDENNRFNTIFYAKICIMLLLGVVALFTYFKFRNSEDS